MIWFSFSYIRFRQAFTFQSIGRAEKTARRNMDRGEKKLHVPRVDRTPLEPPPIIVAVVGPPGVCNHSLVLTFRCIYQLMALASKDALTL